ncbi:MAG: hypothetical protein LQ352_007516 [Teloschistes flavicans]|nr:MAG: hypothetical protein LQ352_007516 [Teloschistes flavicans]
MEASSAPRKRQRSSSPHEAPRKRQRTPSPHEAPRPRKRPGGAARIDTAAKEAVLKRQEAREQEARAAAIDRSVHDVVRQHYNSVPQRGREWRKTDSRIKGLRGLNNWVKSVIIHKFSPNADELDRRYPLQVLDIGCGKGGDLAKWAQAPQEVERYIGIDPAEISIEQARERYSQMGRGGGRGRRPQRTFEAEFVVQDAFTQSIGSIRAVQEVGFDPKGGGRWGGGGFDVVSMMFCMHYAFEDERKARGMLHNIAGALKKGGKFIGTIPNSDVLADRLRQFYERRAVARSSPQPSNALTSTTTLHKDAVPPQSPTTTSNPSTPQPLNNEMTNTSPSAPAAVGHDQQVSTTQVDPPEQKEEKVATWGNSIYHVRFPGKPPANGVFRPPFGWKYSYFLEEAVEAPEYVVPWEAFRALAEEYNLELQYRKPFPEIWKEEKDHSVFRPLSERMGVIDRISGQLLVTDNEMEAAGFYHAFCFYKV